MTKKIMLDEKDYKTLVKRAEDASSNAYFALTKIKDAMTDLILMHEKLEEIEQKLKGKKHGKSKTARGS